MDQRAARMAERRRLDMFRIATALLLVVLAISIPSSGDTLDEMRPVCVCPECTDFHSVRKAPVVKDVKHAMLLGEAYFRVVFGDEVLSKYQPLRAYRRERASGGAYWLVIGSNSQQPDLIDGINVLIDEKYGCLLHAGGEG